jgi:aminopeptidase N
MQHPAFDIKNPNNVYALIRAFGDNAVCFHEKSGAGYRFIADQVLAVDPLNPHVSSVLAQPLSRWQKLNKTQQKYIKEELHRIAKAPRLSKDVYEIVSKSLAV